MLSQLDRTGEDQISLADPESRAMAAHTKADVGYNIQVAVEAKHKLIVEQAVFLDMLGVFDEFETNLRRERQMEGIAAAKLRGVYKGRPPSIDATMVAGPQAPRAWAPPRSPSVSGRAGFDGFLQGRKLTAHQHEFIDMTIDHLTERGMMDPRLLYASPFTDIDPLGVAGVFGEGEVVQLIKILEDVQATAAA